MAGEVLFFGNFFVFLAGKRLLGVSFFLAALALFLLPGGGYYSRVQLEWRQPQVLASHFVLPPPVYYPQKTTGVETPFLTASGVMVWDLGSGVRVYEKNSQRRFLPASTVKMMTALTAVDEYVLTQVLTVPKLNVEGQKLKLVEGETITVENLLYALLVSSANDAAEVLAANYPGGREAFIGRMNEKAQNLNLLDTHFTSPTGIDDPNQYSSASDLAFLARNILKDPFLSRVVSTERVVVYSNGGETAREAANINQLLGRVEGLRGVKTGWTAQAGECLIAYLERDGKKIMTVVLGSQDRFGETEKLIDWVFDNFRWQG